RRISGAWWRMEVGGDSMTPALLGGDRLVVLASRRVAPGHLVVFPDPRHPARILIKRVIRISGESIEVRGDNPWASTDSRDFGPIPASAIWGRAVYRYFPADRAGWLGRQA
ncbi:MAG: nickel-type superoxide dismutase maturation protease, partial [Acidimicrobiales bacterium]